MLGCGCAPAGVCAARACADDIQLMISTHRVRHGTCVCDRMHVRIPHGTCTRKRVHNWMCAAGAGGVEARHRVRGRGRHRE